MKKYILGLLVIVMAVSLSAFTSTKTRTHSAKQTTYDWYAVDYSSNVGGEIPSGATKVFDDYTQADAQANDACSNTVNLHCLRGFQGTPPTFPTTLYDASTPKP
jgi:hypothetical protein